MLSLVTLKQFTMSPKPTLTQLPTELLLEIFNHLDWTGYPISQRGALKRQQPLKESSLVNQRFRTILLPQLFHSLQAQQHRRRKPWHPKRHSLDATCLTNSPDLCALVRKVTYESVMRGDWEALFDVTLSLLVRFTNLRVLSMTLHFDGTRPVDNELSNRGLVSKLPCVREIRVSCHMLALMEMCPNAETLRIDCTHTKGKEPVHILVPSPKITHLYFQVRYPDYEIASLAAAYPNLVDITFAEQNADVNDLVPTSVEKLIPLLPRLVRITELWEFGRDVVLMYEDRVGRWDGDIVRDSDFGSEEMAEALAVPGGWRQRMIDTSRGGFFRRVVERIG